MFNEYFITMLNKKFYISVVLLSFLIPLTIPQSFASPIDDGIKIKWDKDSYLPDDAGVVQIIDSDMNLEWQAIDGFDIHVWSDIDHTGIQLRVTETDENTGIFEGTVFFTATETTSGHRLLVEDAVYAEHKKNKSSSKIINPLIFGAEPDCQEGASLIDGVCTYDLEICEPYDYELGVRLAELRPRGCMDAGSRGSLREGRA